MCKYDWNTNFPGPQLGCEEIYNGSGLRGQKMCFTYCTPHNFDHHKSMQVLKSIFLVWCLLYMAGCLNKSCMLQRFSLFGFFLLCFAFWVNRVLCVAEDGSWMHVMPV